MDWWWWWWWLWRWTQRDEKIGISYKEKKNFLFPAKKNWFLSLMETKQKWKLRSDVLRIESNVKTKKNTHMHTINKCFFYFLNFCAKKRFGIERGEIFEIFFCILKLKLNCGWNLEIWKFFLNWTWLEKFYSFGQPKTKNNRQQLNQIWIMVTNWIEKKIELNENKKTSTEQNRTGFDGYQITQWQCCVYLGCKLTTKLNGNAPDHNHHHHHHKQQQPSALNIRFSR